MVDKKEIYFNSNIIKPYTFHTPCTTSSNPSVGTIFSCCSLNYYIGSDLIEFESCNIGNQNSTYRTAGDCIDDIIQDNCGGSFGNGCFSIRGIGPFCNVGEIVYGTDCCRRVGSTTIAPTTSAPCDCCLGWCLNENTPDCFICSTDCNDYNTVARYNTEELCELARPSYNANCYMELFQNPDCWECQLSANGAYTGPDKNALCLADAEILNQYIAGCSEYCYLIKYCGDTTPTTTTATCCVTRNCMVSFGMVITNSVPYDGSPCNIGYMIEECSETFQHPDMLGQTVQTIETCPTLAPTPTPTPTPTTCPECYKCSQNAGEGETIVDTFRGSNACELCASVLPSYNVNCSTTTTTTHNPCSSPPCCPDETGTSCGANCCCCGSGLAPTGPNCECLPCGSSREECQGTTTTTSTSTSTSTSTTSTSTPTTTTSCPCAGVIATNLICRNGLQQYSSFSCSSPCLASDRAGWPNAGGPCVSQGDFIFTTYQCSCTTPTTTTGTCCVTRNCMVGFGMVITNSFPYDGSPCDIGYMIEECSETSQHPDMWGQTVQTIEQCPTPTFTSSP